MDELEYITVDAVMECDQGGAPDYFKPTFNTKTKIHGCLVATKVDFVPITNIPSFRVCLITQKPCIPVTTPWIKTFQLKINNQETLLGRSKCKCSIGGTIEFITSGQTPLSDEMKKEIKDLQDQADNALEESENESVGEAGFWEGLIPIWGSGRDLINSVQTGDGWGALMNAGFLVWDVASVAAGVVSFGAGTAAMQGAKTGLKATIKAGAKQITKKAAAALAKSKLLAKGAMSLTKDIACKFVRACFTGDTLIHTPKGLIPIEKIRIGDEVLSYNAEEGKVSIRKVKALFEEDVDEILEIITDKDTIQTTRNHPFFVNGEFKDAEQIEIGEFLFTSENDLLEVISLNYISSEYKVYNFEVEDDHCYFVGKDGILVLNACYHTTFFKAFPWLKGKVVVHHAVEQQVLKRWPGLFDKNFMHSLDNLRGIPKELNNTLHLSTIRKEWNQFYDLFKGKTPTKDQVLKYAKSIDDRYGHLFNPPR